MEKVVNFQFLNFIINSRIKAFCFERLFFKYLY